jgi:hypothetical protein
VRVVDEVPQLGVGVRRVVGEARIDGEEVLDAVAW